MHMWKISKFLDTQVWAHAFVFLLLLSKFPQFSWNDNSHKYFPWLSDKICNLLEILAKKLLAVSFRSIRKGAMRQAAPLMFNKNLVLE